jgi:DNA repair exonuclease SbcCD ATPase subunit
MSRLLQDKLKTENDFAQALEEREQQQKQLQNKIDELIAQLKNKDKTLSAFHEDNDKFSKEEVRKRKELEESFAELKERYDKLEEKLMSEEEELKALQSQFSKREKDLLDEKSQLESDFVDLQSSFNERYQDVSRLENLLKMKQSETQLREQELHEYKNRAAKALQLRDKQIEELKNQLSLPHHDSSSSGNNVNSENGEASDAPPKKLSDDDNDDRLMAALDKEDMIMDLERLRAENQELTATLDLLKRQQEVEKTSSRFKVQNLEKALEREKQSVAKLQQNLATLKLSTDELRHKFDTEKKEIQDENRKRSSDIKQLQKKLNTAQSPTSDQSEAELRARALAERLIEKQSQLETLNSEKAALTIELEKAKQRIKEVELVSRITPLSNEASRRQRRAHHTLDIYDDNDDDQHHDVDSAVPVKTSRVFRSLSTRGFFARKLASGMQWIDSISIQSARHLRINPILRVLFVLYIIVIHAWVFYILASTVHILPAHHELHLDTPQHKAVQQNIHDHI